MEILPVTPDRLPEALSLCWNVFSEYNAPTFPLGNRYFSRIPTPGSYRPSMQNGPFTALCRIPGIADDRRFGPTWFFAHQPSICRGRLPKPRRWQRIDTLCTVFSQKAWRTSLSVHAAPYALAFYHGCGLRILGRRPCKTGFFIHRCGICYNKKRQANACLFWFYKISLWSFRPLR